MRVDAVQAQRVLVDGTFRPATVVVDGGRIEAIEPVDHEVDGVVVRAPDTAYVVPGVVDTHVHINEPGRTEWEGFVSATEAAALGGATTLVDMPLNSIPPTTTVEHLELKQEAAAGELMVDVGFWGGAVPGNLDDLEPLWEAGVFGFKCFLAPSGVDEFPPLDRDQFYDALREIVRFDGLMIVHAEDAQILEAAPAPPSRAYRDFLLSRPDAAELAAIKLVLAGARETGARVHILHLSSARALDLIADAKDEGLRVTVETCPHYLCFAAEGIPDGSSQFKCCPPIRDAGNREELWQGLRAGVIDMVVSDHSPATAEEKGRGDGDLQQAWGGVSGLQVGFSAVAQEARRRNIPARGRQPLDVAQHRRPRRPGHQGPHRGGRRRRPRDLRHRRRVPHRGHQARAPQPDLGVRRDPLRRPGHPHGGARQRRRRRPPRPPVGAAAEEARLMIGPINPPPRLLMGPGPINADPRVLRAMSAQLVGQYDPWMTATMNETMALYREVFRTTNEQTFLVDGTSRAGIEAALVSLLEPGDRVLVPVFGRFGHLLTEIAERCRAEVHTIEVPWGEVFDRRAGRGRRTTGAAEGARDRPGRHLDDDVPAAGRPRRDLPAPRRAPLLRRHRVARRQRVRDRRAGASTS